VGVVACFGLAIFSSLLDVCGAWRVALFGERLSFGWQLLQCVSMLLVILGGGVAGYTALEGLNVREALYLSLATVTTVGYGDYKPETDLGKVFTMVYALLCVSNFGYVTSCIGDALFPDADTSVGFGGTESEWDLSVLDMWLGRRGEKKDFSLQLWPRRLQLFLLVALLVAGEASFRFINARR